jgi:osomolarity two-component system response regulator SKN7
MFPTNPRVDYDTDMLKRHGLEAVDKMNAAPNSFDLILMDIIMPHLDGISATVCIREVAPRIPIIAMTSNIRADDIDMYFRYGKNINLALYVNFH